MEKTPLSTYRHELKSIHVKPCDRLEDVVATVLKQPCFHDICVVNEDLLLLGVINIKKLFRALFPHHANSQLLTRQLIELTSSETARDLMVSDPLVARDTDCLGEAIRTMVRHELGELPVVDKQGHLLGSLSMALVLSFWKRNDPSTCSVPEPGEHA